ncbi:hypothetical protein EVAR_23773_1 [Eumeta japonica]|uniref:Uncharacterized protein n=1 Tax=Eumeta variegata TaxID=151549 RepID=A0A4C1VGH0_EUMVA|nr:hypothetical protein EVAR_23773_1 [Eumeta japonica]
MHSRLELGIFCTESIRDSRCFTATVKPAEKYLYIYTLYNINIVCIAYTTLLVHPCRHTRLDEVELLIRQLANGMAEHRHPLRGRGGIICVRRLALRATASDRPRKPPHVLTLYQYCASRARARARYRARAAAAVDSARGAVLTLIDVRGVRPRAANRPRALRTCRKMIKLRTDTYYYDNEGDILRLPFHKVI